MKKILPIIFAGYAEIALAAPDMAQFPMPPKPSPTAQSLQSSSIPTQPNCNEVVSNTLRNTDTIVIAKYTGEHHAYDMQVPSVGFVKSYEYSFATVDFLKGPNTTTVNVRVPATMDAQKIFQKDSKYLLLLQHVDASKLQQSQGYPNSWFNLHNAEFAIKLGE